MILSYRIFEDLDYVELIVVRFVIFIGLERVYMGMFIELVILYLKFKFEKMREYLELFWFRVNILKVSVYILKLDIKVV